MLIAVLSDSHDNIWNLEKAVQIIKEKKCEAIIFCGDFCSPFMGPFLTETGLPVYAVFGNNDEDQWSIVRRSGSEKFKMWGLTDQHAEIELGGKKIAVYHYPKLAKYIAQSGEYDAVFYGHNHQAKVDQLGKTLFANPGAVCGIVSGKPGPASFGLYDTSSSTFELIAL